MAAMLTSVFSIGARESWSEVRGASWHLGCSVPDTMRSRDTRGHVACARLYDDGFGGVQASAPHTISATLWRRVQKQLQWVFTFAGDADVFVIDGVLEHVGWLAGQAPGDWSFELFVAGNGTDILRQVEHRFDDLVRHGVQHRVAVAPIALPDMMAALANAALAELAISPHLLH